MVVFKVLVNRDYWKYCTYCKEAQKESEFVLIPLSYHII